MQITEKEIKERTVALGLDPNDEEDLYQVEQWLYMERNCDPILLDVMYDGIV